MPPYARTVGRDSGLHDLLVGLRLRDHLDSTDRLARHGSRLTPEVFDDLMARKRLRRSQDSSQRSRPTMMTRRRSPISLGMRERTSSPEETSSNAATLRADVRRLTRERDAARDERDAAREQIDDACEGLSDIMDSVEQLRDDVQQLRSQTRRTRNASATSLETESVNSDEVAPSRTRVVVSAAQTLATSASEQDEFPGTG